MASVARAGWNWLKMAWITQPVLFLACVMGGAGTLNVLVTSRSLKTYWSSLNTLDTHTHLPAAGPLIVLLSPGARRWEEERKSWPTHYRSEDFVANCVWYNNGWR